MTITDITNGTGLSGSFVQSLDDFTGQEKAKAQLRVMMASANARDKPLPHLLLASGYEGVGKTNLALLIAAEMRVGFAVLDPQTTAGEALQRIELLEPRSIVFMDEIHRGAEGGRNKLDWLLQPLENSCIVTKLGAEEIPPVTFVAATTDAGKLPKSLLSRFVRLNLEPYTDDEAADISLEIAIRELPKDMPNPTMKDCRAIARAANNNPRVIRLLWQGVRDAFYAECNIHDGTSYDLTMILDWWGYTHDGLTAQAVRYLEVMYRSFPDGAGQRIISEAMHEPGGLAHTEQLLHDKSMLTFTRSGRVLTKLGRQRAARMHAGLRIDQ